MKSEPVPPPFTQDSPDWFGRFVWVAIGFVGGAIVASAAILATDPTGAKVEAAEATLLQESQRATQAENDLAGVRGELHATQDRLAELETINASMAANASVPPPPVIEPPAAQASEESEFISASSLFGSFKANEVAADVAYKGRMVHIRGDVATIGKDIIGTPYVSLETGEDNIGTVQCMFDDAAGLESLRKGQMVDIEGRCSGLLMNVIVRECRLLKN